MSEMQLRCRRWNSDNIRTATPTLGFQLRHRVSISEVSTALPTSYGLGLLDVLHLNPSASNAVPPVSICLLWRLALCLSESSGLQVLASELEPQCWSWNSDNIRTATPRSGFHLRRRVSISDVGFPSPISGFHLRRQNLNIRSQKSKPDNSEIKKIMTTKTRDPFRKQSSRPVEYNSPLALRLIAGATMIAWLPGECSTITLLDCWWNVLRACTGRYQPIA
jgi:hypothetical protein